MKGCFLILIASLRLRLAHKIALLLKKFHHYFIYFTRQTGKIQARQLLEDTSGLGLVYVSHSKILSFLPLLLQT